MEHATLDPREAEHFGKLAADWWDPQGSSAMLHKLNPVRLRYVRAQVDRHFGTGPRERHPLRGKRALDMGCGGGLLTEPLARLGADVTGVDGAAESVVIAAAHAAAAGLSIDYRIGDTGVVAGESFDLVASLEVVEHVTDPRAFVRGLAGALAPGGLLIMSTPNRTPRSRLTMVALGEGLGFIPRGTHRWEQFLTPPELTALLEGVGLRVIDTAGLTYDPVRGARLTDDLNLDYFLTATHA